MTLVTGCDEKHKATENVQPPGANARLPKDAAGDDGTGGALAWPSSVTEASYRAEAQLVRSMNMGGS